MRFLKLGPSKLTIYAGFCLEIPNFLTVFPTGSGTVGSFPSLFKDRADTLLIVLAGHRKLKNDLRRRSIEEIGSRATIFEL